MYLLTDKDPGDTSVSEVSILISCDVAETEEIQFRLPPATCDVNREENGPGDKTSDEADDGTDLEEAE
jgi:hypothetical protein